MKTFIKTKLKKSHDETNIDKYRVAANTTEFISKLFFLDQINHYYKIPDDMSIISCIIPKTEHVLN